MSEVSAFDILEKLEDAVRHLVEHGHDRDVIRENWLHQVSTNVYEILSTEGYSHCREGVEIFHCYTLPDFYVRTVIRGKGCFE